jgi:hypothetical protein
MTPPSIRRPNERQQRAIDFLLWKGLQTQIEPICEVAEVLTYPSAYNAAGKLHPVDGPAEFICRLLRNGWIDVRSREGCGADATKYVQMLAKLKRASDGSRWTEAGQALRALLNKGWIVIDASDEVKKKAANA